MKSRRKVVDDSARLSPLELVGKGQNILWNIVFGMMIAASAANAAVNPASDGAMRTVVVNGKVLTEVNRVSQQPNGKITIMFNGGGIVTTADKLPPEFLASWGIATPADSTATNRVASPMDMAEIKRKAVDGDAQSQAILGRALVRGNRGLPKDPVEGVKWYRQAAVQGLAQAQHELALCYRDGLGTAKDQQESLRWLRKAVDQNYDRAQFDYGNRYLNGTGVDKNEKMAAVLFRQSAEQGCAEAMCNYGRCLRFGIGVAINEPDSLKWFQKAADQGLAQAQYQIGFYYSEGIAVKQDLVEAVRWYRKSAAQNCADAQNNLGYCYSEAKGVPRDYAQAYKWWLLAEAQGHKMAKENIESLDMKITRRQMEEGRRMAQEFKPTE